MRKLHFKVAGISGVIAGLLGASSAYALFTLPTSSVSSTTAYIGDLFTDLAPFIFLAIGIPLAFYVIVRVVGMVGRRGR